MGLERFSQNALKKPSDSSSSLKRKNTHAKVTKLKVQNELRKIPNLLKPKSPLCWESFWVDFDLAKSFLVELIESFFGASFCVLAGAFLVDFLLDFECCEGGRGELKARRVFSHTSPAPCKSPQIIKFIVLPCQMPDKTNATSTAICVRKKPFLEPPSGI